MESGSVVVDMEKTWEEHFLEVAKSLLMEEKAGP